MRPRPYIKASDLLKCLELQENGWCRWLYSGEQLNGWPGLTDLELCSITRLTKTLSMKHVNRIWRSSSDKKPKLEDISKGGTRATFRQPAWSKYGWLPDSPGFVWWWLDRDPD